MEDLKDGNAKLVLHLVGGILIDADDDTRRKAIRRALDAGINWIDTAALYGEGRSERALGWLLREIDDKPYLSTKFRIDTARLDDIPGQIERSLHASLERLRRPSVDLFQLHNHIEAATDSSHALSPDDVLRVADGLDAMRQQGLIRFAGITAIGDAASCRTVIASGRFDSAQVYYNMLNPSAGQAVREGWSGHDFTGILAACRDHGVAAMGIRVFAAGVTKGEMRAMRLGCDLANRIAGAAAVAGTLAKDHLSACAPARAISVLVMNGTGDPLVPYGGGPLMFAGRSRGTFAATGTRPAMLKRLERRGLRLPAELWKLQHAVA